MQACLAPLKQAENTHAFRIKIGDPIASTFWAADYYRFALQADIRLTLLAAFASKHIALISALNALTIDLDTQASYTLAFFINDGIFGTTLSTELGIICPITNKTSW